MLRTPRLHLRPYTESDRDDYVALFTDPAVMAHVDGALSHAAASALFDELTGRRPRRPRVHTAWAAARADGVLVGHTALLVDKDEPGLELAYILGAPHWGQGYATELATALLAYGHNVLGEPRLIATVDSDHPASRRVLEKVGMRPLREVHETDGSWWYYEHIYPSQPIPQTA